MRRYLLDSCALGDLINNRKYVLERARAARLEGARIGTCFPVVGELFYGIELSQTRDVNRERLIRVLSGLTIWPYSRNAAEEYGRLAAELRRAGRAIQSIDLQVAAIALALGRCTVVTDDSDFQAVLGLKVESWAS